MRKQKTIYIVKLRNGGYECVFPTLTKARAARDYWNEQNTKEDIKRNAIAFIEKTTTITEVIE